MVFGLFLIATSYSMDLSSTLDEVFPRDRSPKGGQYLASLGEAIAGGGLAASMVALDYADFENVLSSRARDRMKREFPFLPKTGHAFQDTAQTMFIKGERRYYGELIKKDPLFRMETWKALAKEHPWRRGAGYVGVALLAQGVLRQALLRDRDPGLFPLAGLAEVSAKGMGSLAGSLLSGGSSEGQ